MKGNLYIYNIKNTGKGKGHLLTVMNKEWKEIGRYLFGYLPSKAKTYREQIISDMVNHLIYDYEAGYCGQSNKHK